MVTVTISSDYGYVIVDVILSFFVLMWMAARVGQARKKYNVKYPEMYSATCNTFNCIQRAHQNTLEVYSTFLVFLLLGGCYAPKIVAAGGLIWIIGRVVYAQGYYTGDPNKRNRGAFQYIGLLAILVSTILFAVRLLTGAV